MSKPAFLKVFLRECSLIASRKRLRLITLILPVVSLAIFTFLFGTGVLTDIPVGIVDHDNSSVSQNISSAIDASPYLKPVQVSSLEEGKQLMRTASIFALVYMEKGFGIKAMAGQSPAVPFYYNNDYMSMASVLLNNVTTIISTESARLLGAKLMVAGIPADGLMGYINPINVESHTLFNPYMSYNYYLAPSFLFTMLHFFVLLSALFAFGSELKEATAANTYRLSGNNMFVMLTAKLLPYTIIYMLLAAFICWLIFGYIGLPFTGDARTIAAGSALLVVSYQAMGVVFLAVSGKLLTSLLSASFYSSTAYTFTGMTFPYISMFFPAKVWAYVLPLYHFTEIFLGAAMKGQSFEQLSEPFIWLCGFTALPIILLPRLKKLMLNEKNYGDWGGLKIGQLV